MRIQLATLHCAAYLVPRDQRAEWFDEWNAELCFVSRHGQRQINGFCLGAFWDALWLRHDNLRNVRPWFRWESPVQCLAFLGALAATCVLLAVRYHPPDCPLFPLRQLLLTMLLTFLMALPGLTAVTSLRFGDYRWSGFGWRWAFFGGKVVLISSIVFFGVLALFPIIRGGIGICWMVLYAAALRWAMIDQRLRCPECLRLLAYPAPIGIPSHTFLESHGQELLCTRGHGLLHVSQASTSFMPTQRWMNLEKAPSNF